MTERYFEDLKPGDRFKSQTYRVSKKQIIAFAREFDPQSFHFDEKVARQTMFQELIASGWQTAAISMRLFVQTLNFAGGVIGLGVDELRWPAVVKPNDILQVETEIVRLRKSRSKPRYGIVRICNVTTNQRGEVVQTMTTATLVLRRRG